MFVSVSFLMDFFKKIMHGAIEMCLNLILNILLQVDF